jgi:hypothetical protein
MKLKTIWALAAILFVISTVSHAKCGKDIKYTEVNPGPKNPKVFEPYKKIFRLYAESRNYHADMSEINMWFEDITCPNKDKDKLCVVGLCHSDILGEIRDITIDRQEWKNASYLSREQLLMHEFGHCVLGRSHKDDVDPKTKRPLSIMTPDTISDGFYEAYQKEYIDELFKIDDESIEDDAGCSSH